MLGEVLGGRMSVPFSVWGHPEWDHLEVPGVLSCPSTATPLWPPSPSLQHPRVLARKGMSPEGAPRRWWGPRGIPGQQLPPPLQLSP